MPSLYLKRFAYTPDVQPHHATDPVMSLEAHRADFPQLREQVNGRPIVYLDSAATSLKPQVVIDTVADYYRRSVAAVHRATHGLAESATGRFEGARAEIARFIGAPVDSIVFTRGATESLNLVAMSLGADASVLGPISEHHSNLLPWRKHCSFTPLAVDESGRIDLPAATSAMRRMRPRLVACSTVSNAFGVRHPVEGLGAAARDVGAMLLLDISQSVGHGLVDVTALDCDFACFSGHKMLAPSGVGVLYVHPRAREALSPLLAGGGTVSSVTPAGEVLLPFPHSHEAGTPNVEGVLGLAAASRYLSRVGLGRIAMHSQGLICDLRERLSGLAGVRLFGTDAVSILGMRFEGLSAHAMARVLSDEFGILVRAGQHCAGPAHAAAGVGESLRVSVHLYNTADEMRTFADAVSQILA